MIVYKELIMIYTKFGSRIKILEAEIKTGWCKVETEDGRIRTWHKNDFRADDGINEIACEMENNSVNELSK